MAIHLPKHSGQIWKELVLILLDESGLQSCLLSTGNLRFYWILILGQAGNKNIKHVYKVMTAFQKIYIQRKIINWLGKEGV